MTSKQIIWKVALVLSGAVLVVAGCKKDRHFPNNDIGMIAPLIQTELTANDLLKNAPLSDSTGNLALSFNESLLDLNFDTLTRFPDTSFSEITSFPINVTLFPGQILSQDTQSFNFNISSADLTEIRVKAGTIKVTAKNAIPTKLNVRYRILGAHKNGQPLSLDTSIGPGNSLTPEILNINIDISGYTFDLTGAAGNEINTLETIYFAQTDSASGDTVNAGPANNLVITSTLSDIIPNYASGYFHTQQDHVRDRSDISLLSGIESGLIRFQEAEMALEISNAIGVDFQLILNELTGKSTINQTSETFSHSVIGNSINISRAQYSNSDSYILPYRKTIQFSQDNSNILDFIEIIPDSIIIDAEFAMNPFGNISNLHDFVYTDQTTQINLTGHIPLNLQVENIILQDTLSIQNGIDIPVLDSTIHNVSGFLHVDSKNEFPLSTFMTVILADSSFQYTDTLQAESVLLTPSGQEQQGYNRYSVPLSMTTINQLKQNQNKLIYRVRFLSPNNEYALISGNEKLTLQLIPEIHVTQKN